jgi:PPK2 family polyphosphate:nucleotide phosphotransferase
VLLVFQAMDAAGKDGTIKHVLSGVNPQGCQVWAFKVPTEEELSHDFLWRVHAKTPRKGQITIFNRSHYEDVVVVRVKSIVPEKVWRARYDEINDFEDLLRTAGTRVVKFYLHISRDEQKGRLQSRLDNPDKHWKFAVGDLAERERWDDYMAAYEDAINKCTTEHAPWYVVPANKKWYRNLVIARAIVDTLENMDPRYPEPKEPLDGVTIPD